MWSGNNSNWNQHWPAAASPGGAPQPPPPNISPAAMNPAYFNPQAHAQQQDWAALAQQWIQMQQQPPRPPAPLISNIPPPGNDVSNIPIPSTNKINLPVGKPYGNNQVQPPIPSQGYWGSEKPGWEPPQPPPGNQPWVGPGSAQKATFEYGHNIANEDPIDTNMYDYNHGGPDQYSYEEAPYEDHDWNQSGSKQMDAPEVWEESTISEAKRKVLPSWIREGLEKMEREKQRKMVVRVENVHEEPVKTNVNNAKDKKVEPIWNKQTTYESESEEEIVQPAKDSPIRRRNYLGSKSPSIPSRSSPHREREPSPPQLTPAEKDQQLLLRVKTMLTEILMEVTTSEMRLVAIEVHSKARLRPVAAKQLSSSSALASIAGNLGLGNYESDSEEESGVENRRDSDSDSDMETVKARARQKRSEFERQQASRIYDEEEVKSSKSVTDADNKSHDLEPAEQSGYGFNFGEKGMMIPGLEVEPVKEEPKSEESDKDSVSKPAQKEKTKSPSRKRSRSRSNDRRKRSRSRSRRRSSKYSSRRSKRSRSRSRSRRDRSRYSKSSRKKYGRSRSRSSSSSYSDNRSRSASKDRYKSKKSRSRSRSSSRRSSRHKSAKYKSGKKAS